MKTSNKLLVVFAAALIILPVIVMGVISKVYYIDAKNWVDIEKQNNSFDAKSEIMEAIPLDQFNAINIADGNGTSFYIRLIKDTKHGVKIRKEDKDLVKFSIDKDGKLQVMLTNKTKDHHQIDLYCYAPDTKSLDVNNASTIELNAKGDSLSVSIKKFYDLRFNDAAALNKLSINAIGLDDNEGIGNKIEVGTKVANSLYLNLKNVNFRSESISYKDLSIVSTGKAEIEVFGYHDQKKPTIQNLTLNIADTATVNFTTIDIKNAKGSLSDQTTIQLPMVNLKQILK